MTNKNVKRSKPDESMSSTSISDVLDTLVKDDESLKTLIREICRRDEIMSQLIKPEIFDKLYGKIVQLENKIDDLEQYSRRTCLKISGIEETPNEDTVKLILDIVNKHVLPEGEEKLQLSHIERSHRVGRKNGGFERDIIVRFVSYRNRAAVFRNKKNLKGYNQRNRAKIYINEALTRKRAYLYKQTRAVFKSGQVKSCWTYDGRIYVRNLEDNRNYLINSEDDLESFTSPVPPTPATRTQPKDFQTQSQTLFGEFSAVNESQKTARQQSIVSFGVMTSTPNPRQAPPLSPSRSNQNPRI